MRIYLSVFVCLSACNLLITPLSAALCEQSDSAFLECSDASTKLTCQSGVQVAISCEQVCIPAKGGCAEEFCGDAILDAGEACDDGNQNNEDGCSSDCREEGCGDGILQEGLGEECDDGAIQNDDGCSDSCQDEICGDGLLQPGEECDDNNQNNTDGCDACIEEAGFDCTGEPSVCAAVCGDGLLFAGEECDGQSLGDQDCQSQGFAGGALACDGGCAFDTSDCAPLCGTPITLIPPPPTPPPPTTSGSGDTSSGEAALFGDGCAAQQNGRELVFRLPPPPPGGPPPAGSFLVQLAANDSARDMSFYVYHDVCGVGSVVLCRDNNNPAPGQESATVPGAGNNDIFFVVDSKDPAGEGPFTLTITLQ